MNKLVVLFLSLFITSISFSQNSLEAKALLDEVKESIQKQVERTRESDSTSPKNTTLYFIILLETKDLIQACMDILNLYYDEHDGKNAW